MDPSMETLDVLLSHAQSTAHTYFTGAVKSDVVPPIMVCWACLLQSSPGNPFSARVPPVVSCARTAGLVEESMDSSAAGRRGARGDGSPQADPRDPWLQGGPPVVLCDVAAGFRGG